MRILLAGAVLILDLLALLSIFGRRLRTGRTLLWTAFVVGVPVIGAAGWLRAHTRV